MCAVLLTRDSFRLCYFYVICVFCRFHCSLTLTVVSPSASDRLKRLVSEMTCNVLMGTLNHTHSLAHSLPIGLRHDTITTVYIHTTNSITQILQTDEVSHAQYYKKYSYR